MGCHCYQQVFETWSSISTIHSEMRNSTLTYFPSSRRRQTCEATRKRGWTVDYGIQKCFPFDTEMEMEILFYFPSFDSARKWKSLRVNGENVERVRFTFFWHFKATQKSWKFSCGIFLSRHCRPKLSISCALWAGSNVEGISRRSHKMLTASTGAPLTGWIDDCSGWFNGQFGSSVINCSRSPLNRLIECVDVNDFPSVNAVLSSIKMNDSGSIIWQDLLIFLLKMALSKSFIILRRCSDLDGKIEMRQDSPSRLVVLLHRIRNYFCLHHVFN